MKKIVIVNGLIAGLIVAITMMIGTAMAYRNPNFEGSMFMGYAGMLAAFSLIFVGIKMFRDKHNNGHITFGKAFKIGFLIALIASSIYVAVWLIEYYFFIPDFMELYSNHMLKDIQSKNLTSAEINAQLSEIEMYKNLYKNPFFVILLTYTEILPLGIVVTLISALILKRKQVAA